MTTDEWLTVDGLDQDARGVARRGDGKVVFIDGALPGEQVQCRVERPAFDAISHTTNEIEHALHQGFT